jgi:hypothetical protein
MKTPRRKSTELVLHIARGHKTFCGKAASGVKLQDETDPVTGATCQKCAAVVAALRVVDISEPTLDPLSTLTESQKLVLEEIRKGSATEGWPGFVPHSSEQGCAVRRLMHLKLVVAVGRTVTCQLPCGERRKRMAYKLAV